MSSKVAAALRKVIPLADRVLVKRIEQQAKTASGILLPDSGKKLNEGEVVAVGPGAMTKEGKVLPVNVAVGDRVLLPEYGGHTVKLGEDEYHLYRDEDSASARCGRARCGRATGGGCAARRRRRRAPRRRRVARR